MRAIGILVALLLGLVLLAALAVSLLALPVVMAVSAITRERV